MKDTVVMAVVFASLVALAYAGARAARRGGQSRRRQLHAAARVVLPVAVPAAEVSSRARSSRWRRRSFRAWPSGSSRCCRSSIGTRERRPWAQRPPAVHHRHGRARQRRGGVDVPRPAGPAAGEAGRRLGAAADCRPGAGDRARTALCRRCHVAGGPAAPLEATGLRRDEEWLLNHMIDPVAIAPGRAHRGRSRPAKRRWAGSARRRWWPTCGAVTPASSRRRSSPRSGWRR